MAEVVSLKATRRRQPGLIIGGLLAMAVILGISAAAGWQYINDVPPFTPQLPPMPQPNGYDRADKVLSPGPLLPIPWKPPQLRRRSVPPTWPHGTPDQLRAALAPVRPTMNEVRAAMRLEWRARPLLHESDFVNRMPFMAGARECARDFVAESELARSQGQYGIAIQSSLDAMELGSKMSTGAGLIPRLAGIACHLMGLSEAERTVPILPGNAIREALKRARRLRSGWPPPAEMLESERIARLGTETELFQDYQRQPLHKKLEWLWSAQGNKNVWQTLRLALTPRRVVLANVDRYYRREIAESKKPVRQWILVPVPGDAWSEIVGPSAETGLDHLWRWENVKTDFALLEVALTVRMYYLEHGRYPARLGEIDRRWLPTVPRDLWDQPIAYRLKAGRPVIYSLGPDGRDDGGQAVLPSHLQTTTRGDLVFGMMTRRSGRSW